MRDVHPVAALFPMLRDDELKDLADDIAARGLIQPIVLDSDDRILDGRNRYAACEIACVEAESVIYDGDDPVGYVLAANIARRHMTKGQLAIVIAQACLVSKQTVRDAASQHGISAARIAQARTVIKYASEYVASVVSGSVSLDFAYEQAKDRKAQAAEAERLLTQLRDGGASDLADQVIDGELTAQEAFRTWREREARDEQLQRQRAGAATDKMCDHLYIIATWHERAADMARLFDPMLASRARPITVQTLLDAQRVIDDMLAVWRERGLP
jgi:ParB-like chromosome segregation protein Spo0J